MRVYLRRHYKILLRQCASKTEFAFVSPVKRAHRYARTPRAYISFKGAKNVSVFRRCTDKYACTHRYTNTHTHVLWNTFAQCARIGDDMIHMQATERLRDPSGSFSRVHIMRSHFILCVSFSLPGPLRYRLHAYNVGGRRYATRGKKLLAFSDVSSFCRYSSVYTAGVSCSGFDSR